MKCRTLFTLELFLVSVNSPFFFHSSPGVYLIFQFSFHFLFFVVVISMIHDHDFELESCNYFWKKKKRKKWRFKIPFSTKFLFLFFLSFYLIIKSIGGHFYHFLFILLCLLDLNISLLRPFFHSPFHKGCEKGWIYSKRVLNGIWFTWYHKKYIQW